MIKPWWAIVIAALLTSSPAAAQQGSVQVLSGTLVTTGAPERTGMVQSYQPDFGFSWLQPGTEFGTVQLEVHAVRNDNDPRLGRGLFSLHGMKRAGLTWNLEFGDTTHTPYVTHYGLTNLFAPAVTFRGGTVSAVNARTSFSLTVGRVTVFRDMFGADAQALGQTLLVGRFTEKVNNRLEITAHASRVRTTDLGQFTYTMRSSEEAGAGVRYRLTPTWRVVADAGMTSYQRRDSTQAEHGPSALVGAQWTGVNGSFELNAHRFSPGEFSVFNYGYNDQDGVFAAGQYAILNRLRVDGGWELFRTNLAASNDPSQTQALTTGARARAGLRLMLSPHLSFGARIEEGSRHAGPSRYSVGYESDAGSTSFDTQLTLGRWDAFGRYEWRTDVSVNGTSVTFAQHDVSAQVFFRPTVHIQLSSAAQISERRGTNGEGQSFWQASVGGQVQSGSQRVLARAEVLVSGNRDFQTDFVTPRNGLNLGLNGRLTRHLSVTLDAYVDRSPLPSATAVSPWATRTLVRLVYTLPTRVSSSGNISPNRAAGSRRGTSEVEGGVFIDWNGNGIQDPGEDGLAGVAVALDDVERATTGRDGSFRFSHVAAGGHALRIDLATLPADYDPPAASPLDLTLGRGDRRTATVGVLPLGDVDGTVFRDVNGDGVRGDGDTPVNGAVVVLDDGRRTEVTRQGQFHFPGVGLGSHTVRLLLESLPEDATLAGPSEITVQASRQQRAASASFLVKTEKRPEIRKVFSQKNPAASRRQ